MTAIVLVSLGAGFLAGLLTAAVMLLGHLPRWKR